MSVLAVSTLIVRDAILRGGSPSVDVERHALEVGGCGFGRFAGLQSIPGNEQMILFEAFQCSTLLKYGDRNWARL